MFRKAALAWAAMAGTAVVNGAVRQAVIQPVVGELRAHQLSVVTGSAAFLGVTWLMLRDEVRREPDAELLKLGAGWVAATEAFEFGAGHYLFGTSWSDLLRDYDLRQGRLWPVVLAVLFVAPLAVKRAAAGESGRRVRA